MFQRSIKILLAFILFFVFVLSDTLLVLASSDITPPTVKSIELNKTVVQPGEDINFTLEAEDLESGIAGTPVIELKRNTTTYTEGIYIYLNYNPTTNKFEGTYNVPSNAMNGEWYVSWIYIKDDVGNVFNDVPSEGSTYYRSFTMINGIMI